MKPVDMASIIRKHGGFSVAPCHDRKKVWGKGHTAEKALRTATGKGARDPLLTRIPEDGRSCLL